ncbi:MAG TPA: hypothetical protein VJW76_00610 [Verrucomicrobiae bacterium]|nr:hypothetical protein [Verrucomicrobiae bacterium]
METCTGGLGLTIGEARLVPPARTLVSRPALSQWITPQELETLRETLSRGCLPLDLIGKLKRLSKGDLSEHFIEQNCRLFAALLVAAEDGSFREGSRAERERLLRALAYVRKDDDAIPDYRPDGFADDQREMRAVTVELGALLKAFKAWRLRHQVPAMWSNQVCRPVPAN